MQSIYDDIITALSTHDFTIPNVAVRKPYDESDKHFPLIVVHEITNKPTKHGTVTGELETTLAYQLDIDTQNCVADDATVLTRYEAGRRLLAEASDLLETTFKLTRRFAPPEPVSADVLRHIWRGAAVLDSSGYTYRP